MLFDNASARTLGWIRIWIFGLAAVSRLDFPLAEVTYMTDYTAVGVLRLLGAEHWVPSLTPALAHGVQVTTILLLLAAAAGMRPYHWIAAAACVAFTVSEGMMRGEGVIPHAHMGLMLLTYVLAFFPAADALSPVPRREAQLAPPASYRGAAVTVSLVFAFTYALAATRRLSVGAVGIYFDDSILVATATRDAELGAGGGWGIWACQNPLAAWQLRIGFPVVTLVELLSPLWLFSRWFRWAWIAIMVPFHIGTGLLMGIWFTYNLLLIPILVGGWDPTRRGCGSPSRLAHDRP